MVQRDFGSCFRSLLELIFLPLSLSSIAYLSTFCFFYMVDHLDAVQAVAFQLQFCCFLLPMALAIEDFTLWLSLFCMLLGQPVSLVLILRLLHLAFISMYFVTGLSAFLGSGSFLLLQDFYFSLCYFYFQFCIVVLFWWLSLLEVQFFLSDVGDVSLVDGKVVSAKLVQKFCVAVGLGQGFSWHSFFLCSCLPKLCPSKRISRWLCFFL